MKAERYTQLMLSCCVSLVKSLTSLVEIIKRTEVCEWEELLWRAFGD